jgi:flagellar biosynthesis/type III secretory pathway chaperone
MQATLSVTDTVPGLALAMERVQALSSVLEEEFEALKVQDLDRFEQLLNLKTDLLQELSDITGVRQPEDADALGDEWSLFREEMLACRDMHRRNEILIVRKLDAIRGALDSLQITDPASSVDVYDRLGRVNRMRRGRGYSEA